MDRKATFRDVLASVAQRNALALESKAHTASSLAAAYPESAEVFRSIELAAIRQLYRVLMCAFWDSDTRPTPDLLTGGPVLTAARQAAA